MVAIRRHTEIVPVLSWQFGFK